MKKTTTLFIGLCVLTAFSYTPAPTLQLDLKPADVSATDSANPCMSKKISGKIPALPRMKCRIS